MTLEEFQKALYEMKLGHMLSQNNNSCWLRVPGGWVYSDMQGCCFIPFNKEFSN